MFVNLLCLFALLSTAFAAPAKATTPKAMTPKAATGFWAPAPSIGDLYVNFNFYEDALRGTGLSCNSSLLVYQQTFKVGACIGTGGAANAGTDNGAAAIYVTYVGDNEFSLDPVTYNNYADCENLSNGNSAGIGDILSSVYNFNGTLAFFQGQCNDGLEVFLSSSVPDYTDSNGIGFTLYATDDSTGDVSKYTQICEGIYDMPTEAPTVFGSPEPKTPKPPATPKANSAAADATESAIVGYAWFATGVCTYNNAGWWTNNGGSAIYSYDAVTKQFLANYWTSSDCGVANGDTPQSVYGSATTLCDYTQPNGAGVYTVDMSAGASTQLTTYASMVDYTVAPAPTAKGKGKVKKAKPAALRA